MKQFAMMAIVVCFGSGCFYTIPGNQLPPIDPTAGELKPAIEQTVGDFSFTLEGGKMVTSNFIGRQLNAALLEVWVENGYIESEKYVKSSNFSGDTDYQLTLSGTQYGESNVVAQFFSGLTLYLLPYSVNQKLDIQYLLEDTASGKKYSAAVEDSYKAWVQLFLVFALPVAQNGENETRERMAKHLYSQLYEQGAFRDRGVAPMPSDEVLDFSPEQVEGDSTMGGGGAVP